MLSGALGLQIIARRLGVELGEQQFNKINNIDDREISFADIKKLSSHSIVCRAIKSDLLGCPRLQRNNLFWFFLTTNVM